MRRVVAFAGRAHVEDRDEFLEGPELHGGVVERLRVGEKSLMVKNLFPFVFGQALEMSQHIDRGEFETSTGVECLASRLTASFDARLHLAQLFEFISHT